MILDERELINLFWKSDDGVNFKIGELCRRSGKYYFKYEVESTKKAMEKGFELMDSFPRLDAEYFREELFRVFADRIPNKSRKEYNDNVDENDEFTALKETKGVMDKDSLYFEEVPIEQCNAHKEWEDREENQELELNIEHKD